ncbi:hypothetical protein I2501_31880 [Streptacidiphilus sp. NEAU-YB345]|uniref:Uncharacterized protein n=1 Tax=Streptacidiphilus fuscans TaxID=2789292 RepID=A0A931B9G7_9ACTN|nr:hypothetical protein [Streptacidiphilus fuscans]
MTALRFIGVDPNTEQGESPTVWVDDEKRELVFQGYKPGDHLMEQIDAIPAPDHALGIPDHEYAIRLPFSMIPNIRKACDAADELG